MKKRTAFLLTMLLVLVCAVSALAQGEIIPKTEELIVAVGKTAKARFSATTETVRKSSISYEIGDESIATVNYKGEVKGVAQGETTLTITSRKVPSATATIPVKVVKAVKKVEASVPSAKMATGDTMLISYTLSPEDATIQGATFSSSNEKVAMVNKFGRITGMGRGTATITVQSADGNARAKVKVTVEQMPETIAFKQAEYVMTNGKKFKLKPSVRPNDANNRKVIFASSDESIATVDQNGNVRLLSDGDVTITATSVADETVVGSTIIHSVIPIKSIYFDEPRYVLKPGETLQLEPKFTPEDATVSAIGYAAKNQHICTVDENGLVTAVAGGITTVNVYSMTNENRSAEAEIYVDVPVTGAKVDQTGLRLGVGTHVFGRVKMTPLDATEKGITWISSDTTVATVTNATNQPRIEGHKWGRAILKGTTIDGGFEVELHVNVGTLTEAAKLDKAGRSNGALNISVTNNSDMHLTALRVSVHKGDDNSTLEEITVPVDIAPFASVEGITVPVERAYSGMKAAISGWETDTGFYNNQDVQMYAYRIAPGQLVWKSTK